MAIVDEVSALEVVEDTLAIRSVMQANSSPTEAQVLQVMNEIILTCETHKENGNQQLATPTHAHIYCVN